MCQNPHLLDTKCLKFYNKNVSTLSNIFVFLLFISVQKDIMVCANINKLIFFSNVIKSVKPTYGNKEELAPLNMVHLKNWSSMHAHYFGHKRYLF